MSTQNSMNQVSATKYSKEYIDTLFALADRSKTSSVIEKHDLYLPTGFIDIRGAFELLDLEDKFYFIRMRRHFKRLQMKESEQETLHLGKRKHLVLEKELSLDIINHQAKGLLIFDRAVNDFRGRGYSNTVFIPSYHSWKRLIERCYDPRWHERKPQYESATMCDEWHILSNFDQWHNDNMPSFLSNQGKNEMCLSKDIFPDATVYSPDTCFMIPKKLEHFLGSNKRKSKNGLPLGVSRNSKVSNGRYHAQTKINKELFSLGWYDTPEEASLAYQRVRWTLVLAMAKRYEFLGIIPQRFVDICQERLDDVPVVYVNHFSNLKNKIQSYSNQLHLC